MFWVISIIGFIIFVALTGEFKKAKYVPSDYQPPKDTIYFVEKSYGPGGLKKNEVIESFKNLNEAVKLRDELNYYDTSSVYNYDVFTYNGDEKYRTALN